MLPEEIPIVIAGNKSDLRKSEIPKEKVEKYARKTGGKHFETSAKTG